MTFPKLSAPHNDEVRYKIDNFLRYVIRSYDATERSCSARTRPRGSEVGGP
jgi:hypothetical protein